MEIDAKLFRKRVGRDPENDDLQRCNCPDAGKIGHLFCGWCPKHQLPNFVCGCIHQ